MRVRCAGTIVIAAEGALDVRLRAELREFADSDRLLVTTEFAPMMTWTAANAMLRNRTILGLAKALYVIEAGTSGGSLDAGGCGLKFGVPTFVLDYPEPPSAAGNKLLLSEGAQPIMITPHAVLPSALERGGARRNSHGSAQMPLF